MSDDNDNDNGKDDNQAHYPWDEGMPTKPDVDLLLKTWPTPQVGDKYDYTVIASLVGAEYPSPRFTTVTNVWRNRLEEKGVIVECIRAKWFYVASNVQVISSTYGEMKKAGRKLRKQRKKLSVLIPESDDQRNLITHHGRIIHERERDLKKGQMNLLPSTKIKPVPQIAPPKEEVKTETFDLNQ